MIDRGAVRLTVRLAGHPRSESESESSFKLLKKGLLQLFLFSVFFKSEEEEEATACT